jgi:hypothetical protein
MTYQRVSVQQIQTKKLLANQHSSNTIFLLNYLVRWLNIPWLASSIDNITNEKLLTIVSGQYRNLIGRVANKTHVYIHTNNILSLPFILVEPRRRRGFTSSTIIRNVNKLILKSEPSIRFMEDRSLMDIWQISQLYISSYKV